MKVNLVKVYVEVQSINVKITVRSFESFLNVHGFWDDEEDVSSKHLSLYRLTFFIFRNRETFLSNPPSTRPKTPPSIFSEYLN